LGERALFSARQEVAITYRDANDKLVTEYGTVWEYADGLISLATPSGSRTTVWNLRSRDVLKVEVTGRAASL
jgi:hypothetical protein